MHSVKDSQRTSSAPLLSVIIVSYNTKELTLQTLASVEKEVAHSKLLKNSTEIIIVDNKSRDGSVAALNRFKKNSPVPTKIIENTHNVGFGAANNQAVAGTTSSYVVFLNSDTIVKPGGLENVIATFRASKKTNPESSSELSSEQTTVDRIGIIAATLLNPDGTLQPQGGDLPTLFSLSSHLFFLDDIPLLGKHLASTQHTGRSQRLQPIKDTTHAVIPMGWVGGTALFVSREVLNDIGVFDENIFMYGEDIELCMRAHKRHWDVVIDPTAQIVHLQNQSSSSKNALISELTGYIYLWAKHKPLWQKDFALFIVRIGALLRYFIYTTIMPNSHKATAYKEAVTKLRQL